MINKEEITKIKFENNIIEEKLEENDYKNAGESGSFVLKNSKLENCLKKIDSITKKDFLKISTNIKKEIKIYESKRNLKIIWANFNIKNFFIQIEIL